MATPSKHYHVSRADGSGWKTQREGSERASAVTRTQREAIDRGRDLAKQTHGELRIHGEDGKFREAYSYGNDPRKSKG